MPAPVTANTIPVTQQAQLIFATNASTLSKVRDTVDSVTSNLTNSGADPVSTNQLTAALERWNAALDDIISTSYWMADMLDTTWRLIQKNEQDNTDLAAGLTEQPEPTMPPLSRLNAANDTTVAPGQTVVTGVAIRSRMATVVHPP
jgi:response regulator of citrate/malate metabolism